eukprot:c39574_g1_i1.p1 GENE.c39574_g1_i1~~c39574_g1_i1.p1  ORF type:complete len:473 (-),score=38.80 c39574_g1_i1:27-1445(-)
MGLDTTAVAAIVVGGVTGGLVLIILLFAALVSCSRRKSNAEPPARPSMCTYILHKHLLLAIVWSGPVIRYQPNYAMNRARHIVLFAVVFLLNFIVCGIVFAASQPAANAVDCTKLDYCFNGCPNCPLSEYRVGFDGKVQNFIMRNNPASEVYRNCSSPTKGTPCFTFCNRKTRGQYKVDTRPTCASQPGTVSDLLCMVPSTVKVCHAQGIRVGSAQIPLEFNLKDIIFRVILTIVIVFPSQWAIKSIMRCTYRSEGTCACFRKSAGFLLILIFAICAAIVAIILIRSLQNGSLWGAVAVSFLLAFAIGLLLDFPKLVLIYICVAKRKLAEKYVYCYAIFLKIQEQKREKEFGKLPAGAVAAPRRKAPVRGKGKPGSNKGRPGSSKGKPGSSKGRPGSSKGKPGSSKGKPGSSGKSRPGSSSKGRPGSSGRAGSAKRPGSSRPGSGKRPSSSRRRPASAPARSSRGSRPSSRR